MIWIRLYSARLRDDYGRSMTELVKIGVGFSIRADLGTS